MTHDMTTYEKCLFDIIDARRYYRFVHKTDFSETKLLLDGQTLECRAPCWVVEICRVMDCGDPFLDSASTPDPASLADSQFANRLFHAVSVDVLERFPALLSVWELDNKRGVLTWLDGLEERCCEQAHEQMKLGFICSMTYKVTVGHLTPAQVLPKWEHPDTDRRGWVERALEAKARWEATHKWTKEAEVQHRLVHMLALFCEPADETT